MKPIRDFHKNNPNLPLCQKCGSLKNICMCDFLTEQFHSEIKISIMLHFKELFKVSNSGKFAIDLLENSHMEIFGYDRVDFNLNNLILEDHNNILLFPTTNNYLTKTKLDQLDKPLNIIVPDGSWKQAKRMVSKFPEIYTLPRFKLENDLLDKIRIRTNHIKDNVSTIEAIALLFQLNGEEEIHDRMVEVYDIFTAKFLADRNQLP